MKMKNIVFLLIMVSYSSFSQSFSDYFPLKIGEQFRYNYRSIEKEYFDIAFMNKMTTDSGTIHYTFIDSSNEDSVISWNVEEEDSVIRHIQDYFNNLDTMYLIKSTVKYQLYEYMDSLHTINCKPYFPPFTFPISWYFGYISSPVYRYGVDSTYKFKVDVQSIPGSTWSFMDTLLFQRDEGLIYAKSITNKGPNTPYYYEWEASLISRVTNVESDMNKIPTEFKLFQNYPNPFNPDTKITYLIPYTGFVSLKVYDIIGKEIATLVAEVKSAGKYEINFKANNLSSGVYFYRIKVGNFSDTKKFIIIR